MAKMLIDASFVVKRQRPLNACLQGEGVIHQVEGIELSQNCVARLNK